MRVQEHVKISTAAALIALPWLKKDAWIPLAASVLIDVDHYLWHTVTHRTLSLRAAVRYFGQADPPQLAEARLLHHPIVLGLLLVLAMRTRSRILNRAPFLVGAALFILLGLIPPLGQLFASLPVSVGDAVLFVAYLQLFGSGLSLLEGMKFTFKTIYRIALPVLLGLSLFIIPSTAFGTIPDLVRSLVQNGLVMGILVAMIVQFAIPWKRIEKPS